MDAQDVAVWVAEPRLMEFASGRDPVHRLDLRKVVLLETHPALAQLVDRGSDVADFPRRERVLRLTRAAPLVDLEQRTAAAPIHHLLTGGG
jgi:hypothetical protein